MDIGLRIRQLRKRQRLTQKQVAARAGWSASYQSQLEKGRQKWNRDNLARLADVLGVALLDFFREPPGYPSLEEGEAAKALTALAGDAHLSDDEKEGLDREIAHFISFAREKVTPYGQPRPQDTRLPSPGEPGPPEPSP